MNMQALIVAIQGQQITKVLFRIMSKYKYCNYGF